VRLLLAEDDPQLRDALARGLRDEAFAVDVVDDGHAAIMQAAVHEYDAIVLDVLMPGRDGIEVCTELRRRGMHTPVLLLTALDAVDDRIRGLDAGADDYLTKPFAFGELLARLRALLRRRGEVLPPVLRVADLEVDVRTHSVRRGTRFIELTAREFTFLAYLARHAGRVVSRSELAAHVWDDNHDPQANLLDVYVSRIRRKVDGGEAKPLLHTRRGAGVMLHDVSEDGTAQQAGADSAAPMEPTDP
jgi:two-component system copper resistance phosphate regulon response regulator CusR